MAAARPAVYLDGNATTPIFPEAGAAMAEVLGEMGNPSSVHAFGRAARRRREAAREQVAALVGVGAGQVVFTSGATEANALALHGRPGTKLLSAVEHPSVLENAPVAARVPVDHEGRADLGALEALLMRHRPALVALMLANNETGVVQPVAAAATLAHAHGARLLCDAVQGPGKLAVSFVDLGCDLLALSAHKFGGPPGVGALVVAGDLDLQPLVRGGGQELRRRAGTENLPGIVAMGNAAERVRRDADAPVRLVAMREWLEGQIAAITPDAVIFGAGADRLPNTTCVALAGLPAETQLIRLDLAGIAVSAGAACSSGKVGPSHVLAAMGVAPELARSAIRISLTWRTEQVEIDRFIEAWSAIADTRRVAA